MAISSILENNMEEQSDGESASPVPAAILNPPANAKPAPFAPVKRSAPASKFVHAQKEVSLIVLDLKPLAISKMREMRAKTTMKPKTTLPVAKNRTIFV